MKRKGEQYLLMIKLSMTRHCILCCCPYVHGQKIQPDPNDRMRTGKGGGGWSYIGQDMDE